MKGEKTLILCCRCFKGLFLVPRSRDLTETEELTIHGRCQQHLRECQVVPH